MCYQRKNREIMHVMLNGQSAERPVIAVSNFYNGYRFLSVPFVEDGESLYWQAGSRVPIIEGVAHA